MKTILFLIPLFVIQLYAESPSFFDGKSLKGWNAPDMSYWSVKNKTIIGHSDKHIKQNQFLWSEIKVSDFYLKVDVKITPNERNAGIQFRSTQKGKKAHGYQADIGKNVWARLYHEHGRGKLDWRDHGEKAVKMNDWNTYEILAVGDKIWTAINGKLAVSIQDPFGEREGYIALQIHSGPAQTVQYRNPQLIHQPKIKIAGLSEEELNRKLIPPLDVKKQKQKLKK